MFITLTALALADGLHLLAIAALAFLLGRDAPLVRVVTFMAALIGTHFAGGVLLIAGWGLIAVEPPGWWLLVEWSLVVALVAGAVVRVRAGGDLARFEPPASVTLPAIAGMGAMVTLADLAFDLPYHLAAARIAGTVPSLAGQLAWLAWFNAVYALPMLAAAGVWAVVRRRVARPAHAAGSLVD